MHFLAFWILRPNAWLRCCCCKMKKRKSVSCLNGKLLSAGATTAITAYAGSTAKPAKILLDLTFILHCKQKSSLIYFCTEEYLHLPLLCSTRGSPLETITSCPLAGKVTVLMRHLLERQALTVRLGSLRKEGRNWINNEISQVPSSRALRLRLLTRLTMSVLCLSEHCHSTAFCQH